jgi:hypothetical protein
VSRFKGIDDAIVAEIGKGCTQFAQLLNNQELEALAIQLSEGRHSHAWRVLDRRLQAIRKAGRIAYDRTDGWSVLTNTKDEVLK